MNRSLSRLRRTKVHFYPGLVILLASTLVVLLYQLDSQKNQLHVQQEMLQAHGEIVRQLAEQTILLESYRQSDIERLSTKLHIARLIIDMAPHLKDQDIVRLANVIYDESQRYQFDWKWLLALIEAESDFNPKAKSPAGACGLMQLMPDTAREIARKLDLPFDERKTLYDLELNVRLGAYYFHQLLKQFNNYERAITAYIYGPNRVRRSATQADELANQYRKKVLETYAYLAQISPS